MNKSRHGLLLIIVCILVSCRQDNTTDLNTPTPFSVTRFVSQNPATEPIAISLTHLAANPEFFEGSTLQLAGDYQKLPVLSCNRDPHPSPASWGILDEGLFANASGLDEPLRSLLVENQPIVVEGLWLRYIGPVGCGKSAPVQEIWYLSVNRIVEPHPLAKAGTNSAIENDEPTEIGAVPEITTDPIVITEEIQTPPIEDELTPTLPAESTTTPSGGFEITATSTEEATIGPIASPLSSPTSDTTVTSVATVTITNTIPAGATATSETSTPTTETFTPGPSPTITPSPEGQNFNDRGSIGYEDLRIESLSSGTPDRWTLAIDTTDSITITVAPASAANIIISLEDENGLKVIDAQDLAPAGEVETITDFNITDPGIYEIYIATDSDVQSDYALMVMNSESYTFKFKGTLIPSSPRSESLNPETDHFWFFPMTDGIFFNIRVTPNNQTDPYLELFDPLGNRVLTIDDTGTGETELLEDYEAQTDGLYSIRVGEFEFTAMNYQILLTKS